MFFSFAPELKRKNAIPKKQNKCHFHPSECFPADRFLLKAWHGCDTMNQTVEKSAQSTKDARLGQRRGTKPMLSIKTAPHDVGHAEEIFCGLSLHFLLPQAGYLETFEE